MKKKAKAMRLLFLIVCMILFLCGCRRREDEEALAEFVLQETDEEALAESVLQETDEMRENADTEIDADTQAAPQQCYIHIYGAVKNPGVYLMEPDERIFQAVERAGGFTDDACEEYVNLAKSVADGLKIWIPTNEEASELRAESEAAGSESAPGEEAARQTVKAADAAGAPDENAGLFYPQQEAADDGKMGMNAAQGGKVNINTAAQEELCTLTGIGEAKARAIIAYREAHGGFAKPEDIMKVTGIKQSGYEKIQDQITVGEQ